jgi:FMN phosphatase YigB (HAD superfamily)
MDQTYWLVDFDDTLAVGLTTWGYAQAIPDLVQQHDLVFDATQFESAMLIAQEQASRITDPTPVIDEFLENMGWPSALRAHLLEAMRHSYQPELFEDAVPFLNRLQAAGKTIYIVSNNPRTPGAVEQLGLTGLVNQVFTPKRCPGTSPKPHCSLFDYIAGINPAVTRTNAVVVGDDPWSDGAFAKNCGLAGWLVDRHNRFETLTPLHDVKRVQSLLDIVLSQD